MKPGHEECGHEKSYIHVWGQSTPIGVEVRCDHDHLEPVQADDGLGLGPVVADYCHCCDKMMTRTEFLR